MALDLALDDDLRRRGYVRDLVRQVQDLRKASGLDVSDRIELTLAGLDDLSGDFDQVATEVLAVSVVSGSLDGEGTVIELDDERTSARAWLRKAD